MDVLDGIYLLSRDLEIGKRFMREKIVHFLLVLGRILVHLIIML
jgi:hypothetical protein